jgi:hypothetical protein
VVPMPGILGDDSSDSEGEGLGAGDASPPRDARAGVASLRRPAPTQAIEVSEDEAEAQSSLSRFQSVAFWAFAQQITEAGTLDAVRSPLHLGKLSVDFSLPSCFVL